jgi:hypothetical protein
MFNYDVQLPQAQGWNIELLRLIHFLGIKFFFVFFLTTCIFGIIYMCASMCHFYWMHMQQTHLSILKLNFFNILGCVGLLVFHVKCEF